MHEIIGILYCLSRSYVWNNKVKDLGSKWRKTFYWILFREKRKPRSLSFSPKENFLLSFSRTSSFFFLASISLAWYNFSKNRPIFTLAVQILSKNWMLVADFEQKLDSVAHLNAFSSFDDRSATPQRGIRCSFGSVNPHFQSKPSNLCQLFESNKRLCMNVSF